MYNCRKTIKAILVPVMGWMVLAQYYNGHLPCFVCPMKYWANAPCPFCGLTRSCCLLLHGNMKEAILLNPLIILVLFSSIILAGCLISNRFLLNLKRKNIPLVRFYVSAILLTWFYNLIISGAY